MTEPLGTRLLNFCRAAREELFLACPFVKVDVITKILDACRHVPKVILVTRWLPYEISTGVSDLEVWDVLRDRDGASVYLLNELHAKYFRADNSVLVGSANLTRRALGWTVPSNVEVLVELDYDVPELLELERLLREASVKADDDLVWELRELLRLLPPVLLPPIQEPVSQLADPKNMAVSLSYWLPTLRHPENLFRAYSGAADSLTRASRDCATNDLRVLSISPGLSEEAFRAAVGAALLQMPVVRKLDGFLEAPRRFGAVTHWLRSHLASEAPGDSSESWQTLMRWLMYFLPRRYELEVPNYSEVFRRKKRVPR